MLVSEILRIMPFVAETCALVFTGVLLTFALL
jgi:hypothetical protein